MVETTETEEGGYVLRILGYRPIRNCLTFFGYRSDSLASHDDAHELDFRLSEIAFLEFNEELMFL